MIMLNRTLSFFLVFFLFTSGIAGAEENHDAGAAERYVKIKLLPERGKVQAGEKIWIGIEQSIHPGWHTYWSYAGDSGAGAVIDWSLPEGASIRPIQWPTPQKFPYPRHLNYGYKDNVILFQQLTLPESLPDGPLELKAKITVLVCEDICIPESGEYTLTLNAPEGEPEDNEAYLTQARAKLPVMMKEKIVFSKTDAGIQFRIPNYEWCSQTPRGCADVAVFPYEWGILKNTAPVETRVNNGELVITQDASTRNITNLGDTNFVFGYHNAEGEWSGVEFTASYQAASTTEAPETQEVPQGAEKKTLLYYVLAALLGGLVLNLMPCVFPILSIKALSLVKLADAHPAAARLSGIAYTAGVVSSFLLIAGILVALQAGGSQIGWGFHLQNPLVVAGLAYLLFLVGLNLMDFFEINVSIGGRGSRLANNKGASGAFFTGVLATLVATPCTAPFMATAIGFALTQGIVTVTSVFAALGFGLALPYLALSFIPALRRVLPKPGAWMVVFKQFLAFPMFFSAAWLLWVLAQQAGATGAFYGLIGMIFLGFAIWLMKVAPKGGWRKALSFGLAFISLMASIAMLFLSANTGYESGQSAANTGALYSGDAFSPQNLEAALETGDPVFVEMTAAWCITCKVNHASSIDVQSTKDLFAKQRVKYMVGDWTNYDPVITEYLKDFGRNGVPIYVFYGAPDAVTQQRPRPVVLPQILTPAIVRDVVLGKTAD